MNQRARFCRLISLLSLTVFLTSCGEEITSDTPLDDSHLKNGAALAGLDFTTAERELMREDVGEHREAYAGLRSVTLDNGVLPAVIFDPLLLEDTAPDLADHPARWSNAGPQSRPGDLEELAFASVSELSRLIHDRQITCVELTELCLSRLRRHDARVALRGHPAARSGPGPRPRARPAARPRRLTWARCTASRTAPRTCWPSPAHPPPGAPHPTGSRCVDETATVVRRLDEAGAVLVAKLTLGALAWGDVWFGGTTRNPWNLEQGSSGSSAGSAAAVSAGLVPFAIGTETWGSIVSPAPAAA